LTKIDAPPIFFGKRYEKDTLILQSTMTTRNTGPAPVGFIKRSAAKGADKTPKKRGRPEVMVPPPTATIPINSKYQEALARVLFRIAQEQTATLQANGRDRNLRVNAFPLQGHQYDRIIIDTGIPGKTAGDARVYVFVHKESGTILGRKSDTLPNQKMWFATIYDEAKWTFGGIIPAPIDMNEANVHIIGTYGDYVYYAPGSEPESDESEDAVEGLTGEEITGEEGADDGTDGEEGDENPDRFDNIDPSANAENDNVIGDEPATDNDPTAGVDDGLEDWERMEPIGVVVSGPPASAEVDEPEPVVSEGQDITDPEFHSPRELPDELT
jgi:hypothetical protein